MFSEACQNPVELYDLLRIQYAGLMIIPIYTVVMYTYQMTTPLKYISSKIMSYYRPADLDGIRCGYVRSSR